MMKFAFDHGVTSFDLANNYGSGYGTAEETLQALVDIVRMRKALYVGILRWLVEASRFAFDYLKRHDTPCLLFQDRLNLVDRRLERDETLECLRENRCGFIAFSPLAQGILTNRYLNGIPADSRAMQQRFLKSSQISDDIVAA